MIIELQQRLTENRERVNRWFEDQFRQRPPFLYTSVDLRNSHHKIAVVDTNAYPAGFNNLCTGYFRTIPPRFQEHLERFYPGLKSLLIFPELHSRNLYYLQNLICLSRALSEAGFEVRVGSIDPDLREDSVVHAAKDGEITLHRIVRQGDRLLAGGFDPDLIVSNNDFSDGVPEVLEGLSQPVIPAPGMGWHRRRKDRHFRALNRLSAEFGQVAGIDPWWISTQVGWKGQVDFDDPASREGLAGEVDKVLGEIGRAYRERGIGDEPFVFIKNNAGTYGMAVMIARSGDEIRKASHQTRTKMRTGKGHTRVGEVLIQEGIPTRDSLQGSPMEPVIYLVGEHPVGGFYRLHRDRNPFESLNVRGMEFHKLCFHQVEDQDPESLDDECEDAGALLDVYGALARLACLAMTIEFQEMEDEDERKSHEEK
jgi:glutamate--cysteine ligase